jgi:hypothetical protein
MFESSTPVDFLLDENSCLRAKLYILYMLDWHNSSNTGNQLTSNRILVERERRDHTAQGRKGPLLSIGFGTQQLSE